MLEHILLQTILIPALSAPLVILLRPLAGRKAAWIARLGLLYTTALLLLACMKLYQGGVPLLESHIFAGPEITLDLLGDGISLPVALIINLLCLALSVYADHYINHRIEAIYGAIDEQTARNHYTRFYALYLLFPTGFMGVCFASNLIGIYFFLEILPLPLYFIMAMFGYIDRVRVAMICLMWAVFGAGFFLVGAIIVYYASGTFAVAGISTLAGTPAAKWAIAMFLVTIMAKMAVVPFQVWMPWVHAEHPTCIAGLLAVYANIAVYVMLRLLIIPLPADFQANFALPMMFLALVTMVYGALLTLGQTDIKRFAACSTISQLAYSLLGVCTLTTAGIEGGMLFFLGHIMGKTILFSTAGIIVYTTGIRDMRQFGGLARKMPVTTALWIIAALSLAGFPPMSSFPAEWIMFTGIFKAGITGTLFKLLIAIGGVAAVTLSVVYCFRSVRIIFFGSLSEKLANDNIKDPPLTMSLPLLGISAVSVILGIYPRFVLDLFHQVIGPLVF